MAPQAMARQMPAPQAMAQPMPTPPAVQARFDEPAANSAKAAAAAPAPMQMQAPANPPPMAAGSYGSGVRAQVFEVIVRQAIAGAPWPEICAGPMAINSISVEEVEAEVGRRVRLGVTLGLGNGPIMLRQFAHQVRPDRKPTDRVDFSETVYWNAGIQTDATTGEATVSFALSDSVTTFRAFADAFAGDGAVGAADLGVEAVQPFYAEAKLPLEVTAGDQILLPINLINATTSNLPQARVKVDLKGNFELPQPLKGSEEINAQERVRWIQPINVGVGNGLKDFVLEAKGGEYEDTITRKLCVKPKGYPIEISFAGMLEPGKTVRQTITIPADVEPTSLLSNTAVYPTPLANLTEALQRMIQDPHGCFEQTSSTS
jgi:uncharacterized protein YfaS (alpha-2-macroglobulin family)